MQGACEEAFPSAADLGLKGAALKEQKPGQCLIVSDARILEWGKHLWMDSLYFRFNEHPRYLDNGRLYGFFYGYAGDVFMTNVTMQARSSGTFISVHKCDAQNGPLCFAQCLFGETGRMMPLFLCACSPKCAGCQCRGKALTIRTMCCIRLQEFRARPTSTWLVRPTVIATAFFESAEIVYHMPATITKF